MKYSEAERLKNRILACRQNELTKRILIKKVFAIIDQMREPEGVKFEITTTHCPRCGTLLEKWRFTK